VDRWLEEAAVAVAQARRRAIEFAAVALGAAGAAIVAAPLEGPVAISLAAGAVFEALLALRAAQRRREWIALLAVDPGAYVLPEVRRYGERCTDPRERARLVVWLTELAQLPQGRGGGMYLGDRVLRFKADLEWLARALSAPTRMLEPASVVTCRGLLTHPSESGLYNPHISEDDLYITLRRIRLVRNTPAR